MIASSFSCLFNHQYFSGVVPATIPIVVGFSATTAGTSGANNGVHSIALIISGTAMAGQAQAALTSDPVFTTFAFLGGLGFNLLPGGSGGVGGIGEIAGIGNAQALPGGWNAALHADNVGHAGNVPVASGNVATGGQTGTIETTVGYSNLWTIGHVASFPSDATLLASPLTITAVIDSDGDGVLDETDNCPQWYNPAQDYHHADFDCDCDVDGNDFLTFSNAYNGSLNPPIGTQIPNCP